MKIGDIVSFEKDGVIFSERIQSVHYTSASPALYRQLNHWQRIVRRLTAPRWRKSLLVRAAEPSRITINDGDPVGRTLAQIEQMRGMFDWLMAGPVPHHRKSIPLAAFDATRT